LGKSLFHRLEERRIVDVSGFLFPRIKERLLDLESIPSISSFVDFIIIDLKLLRVKIFRRVFLNGFSGWPYIIKEYRVI